jgi:hypoxanthine phosphoribosyltransferase
VHQDIQRILFDAERIRARVHALGQAISRDLSGRDVVLLALLKGSVVFVADLLRAIDIPVRLDFAWVSSYGDGTESSGEIQIRVFPDGELAGRTVLIVDDILDTGRTLSRVVERIHSGLRPADVRVCVLLDKAARRKVPVEAHYVGFPVEDVFVVGYGLDHADRYRNLPYIGVLSPERYVPAPT